MVPAVQAVYRRLARLVFGSVRLGRRRRKPHGRAVHAITLAGRGRAVGKHMAQMRAAIAAHHFRAPHEQRLSARSATASGVTG